MFQSQVLAFHIEEIVYHMFCVPIPPSTRVGRGFLWDGLNLSILNVWRKALFLRGLDLERCLPEAPRDLLILELVVDILLSVDLDNSPLPPGPSGLSIILKPPCHHRRECGSPWPHRGCQQSQSTAPTYPSVLTWNIWTLHKGIYHPPVKSP